MVQPLVKFCHFRNISICHSIFHEVYSLIAFSAVQFFNIMWKKSDIFEFTNYHHTSSYQTWLFVYLIFAFSCRICHRKRKDDDWNSPPRFLTVGRSALARLTVFVHLQRTLAFREWWVEREEICINHSKARARAQSPMHNTWKFLKSRSDLL